MLNDKKQLMVSQLPDEVKFAAICNQIEQENKPNEDIPLQLDDTNGNFSWYITPQKGEFWERLDESFGHYIEQINID